MRTVLGVSNISFGLPCRGYLNTTFLTMAMAAGLDLAIMNPNTPEMMAAVRAYRVLTWPGFAEHATTWPPTRMCRSRRARSASLRPPRPRPTSAAGGDALFEAVRRGLKAEARAAADAALTMREPLDVVERLADPGAGRGGRRL